MEIQAIMSTQKATQTHTHMQLFVMQREYAANRNRSFMCTLSTQRIADICFFLRSEIISKQQLKKYSYIINKRKGMHVAASISLRLFR